MAGITGIALLGNFPRNVSEAPDRKLWQLTSSGGLESDAAWAPDGQRSRTALIATATSTSGRSPFGDVQPVRLTSSPRTTGSPLVGRRKACCFPIREGRRRPFRGLTDGRTRTEITNFGYRPRWSPREPTILFSSSNTVRSKLYVAGADGGQPRQVLAAFLDEFASFRAAWHPDGHRISVFGAHRRDGISFWTVSLTGPPRTFTVNSDVAIRSQEDRRQPDGIRLVAARRRAVFRRLDPRKPSTSGASAWTRSRWNGVMAPNGSRSGAVSTPTSRSHPMEKSWPLPFGMKAHGCGRCPSIRSSVGNGERRAHHSEGKPTRCIPMSHRTACTWSTARFAAASTSCAWCSLIAGDDRMLPIKGEMLVPRWSDDGNNARVSQTVPPSASGGCAGARSCWSQPTAATNGL